MDKKTIYQLKLHEWCIVEDANLFTTALRVPGGWMYRSYDKSCNILTSIFVPFSYDLQDAPQ